MNELEKTMYDGAVAQYAKIPEMEVGTEEYTRAVNGAGSIVDRLNEARRLKIEEAKLEVEKQKNQLEKQRIKVDERDRWAKIGADVGKFIVGGAVFGIVTYFTTGFELGHAKSMDIARSAEKKLLNMFNIKV